VCRTAHVTDHATAHVTDHVTDHVTAHNIESTWVELFASLLTLPHSAEECVIMEETWLVGPQLGDGSTPIGYIERDEIPGFTAGDQSVSIGDAIDGGITVIALQGCKTW